MIFVTCVSLATWAFSQGKEKRKKKGERRKGLLRDMPNQLQKLREPYFSRTYKNLKFFEVSKNNAHEINPSLN